MPTTYAPPGARSLSFRRTTRSVTSSSEREPHSMVRRGSNLIATFRTGLRTHSFSWRRETPCPGPNRRRYRSILPVPCRNFVGSSRTASGPAGWTAPGHSSGSTPPSPHVARRSRATAQKSSAFTDKREDLGITLNQHQSTRGSINLRLLRTRSFGIGPSTPDDQYELAGHRHRNRVHSPEETGMSRVICPAGTPRCRRWLSVDGARTTRGGAAVPRVPAGSPARNAERHRADRQPLGFPP